MNNHLVTLVLMATLSLTSSSEAQEHMPAKGDWSGSVGLIGGVFPKYPGSADYAVVPIPMLTASYKGIVFLDQLSPDALAEVGGLLVQRPSWNLALALGLTDARPESRGDPLVGMGDRGVGWHTAAVAQFQRGRYWGSAIATFGLNNDQSWGGRLTAGLRGRLVNRFYGTVSANAAFADTDQMNYHFGVDAAQAARRSGLIATGDPRLAAGDSGPYTARAGLKSVGLSTSLAYPLSRRWKAFGLVALNRYSSTAAESPLVQQREWFVTVAGLSYAW